jgi:hypothetical protein
LDLALVIGSDDQCPDVAEIDPEPIALLLYCHLDRVVDLPDGMLAPGPLVAAEPVARTGLGNRVQTFHGGTGDQDHRANVGEEHLCSG